MASSLWELLNKYKVVIPIMQRDYAQGRTTGKVPTIRENLLNSICSTIQTEGETLQLDFIYGYTKASRPEEDKNRDAFYPLDGQQRLTTLFLLHWYIAAKEGHLNQVEDILANFSYETRHSSKVFCAELVKYIPISFEESIQASIVNQPWFFAAWRNDPTIQSMLTMLDAIQQKVDEYQLTNVWQRLIANDAAIVFHLLPMDELGLPDDLYIKMNSRGKELTDFEYYKVRLSEAIVDSYSDEFNHKIDKDWYDLIWDMYKYDDDADIAHLVDSAFLRLLRYLTDLIIEKFDLGDMNGLDELGIFDRVYSAESNVKLLFNVFDKLVELRKDEPEFFPTIFYIDEEDFSVDKTRLFFQNPSVNLLKKCADSYDPKQRNNPFSLGEQLLLYACIIHIINKTEDFNYRIRKIRNLISNSEDTVRKENLRSLLLSIEEIVLNNNIDADAEFSSTQMFEEGAKAEFLDRYPAMKETLFKLEDHQLLQGCAAIFKLSPDLDMHTNRFFSFINFLT
jgi:hypothetical protein